MGVRLSCSMRRRQLLIGPFLMLIVWRIVVGLSLIPAFGTLYQRLTLPESTRYEESQKLQMNEESFEEKQEPVAIKEVESGEDKVEEVIKKKAHFSGNRLSNV